MEIFQDIAQILSSGLSEIGYTDQPSKTDRVLKSTGIEQAIFDDLCTDAEALSECEMEGKEKLKSFGSLFIR